MADGNLGEANVAGDLSGDNLVLGMGIAVHEHDGRGAQTLRINGG